MLTHSPQAQAEFYREFLMGRHAFEPKDHGVNLEFDEFRDQMIEEFHGVYRDTWTIDELCLHPREALRFCDEVKRKHGYYDMPDDCILRVIMGRRKRPND